jgi:GNAT superfamily N-acetyltransferase
VTIRTSPATPDDIPDILASADALVATDAGRHDAAATNLGWAAQTGIAYCTALLASDDNLVLLSRDGDDVAGHLVGRLHGPGSVHPIRVAELESIHVYPRHRNRGAGEQLMTAFLAWAAERGAQRATVTAYAANDGAQRFYARHGFALKSVILDLDSLPPARPADPDPGE